MFQRIIFALIIISSIEAQDYAWPIKASQSLSATFCEYRKGHLHAGIDIKTWGEMEVPCLAVSEGYIQKVIIGYSGYGRGLFMRTSAGHIAVYGHLERFMPAIEKLILEKQLAENRYRVSLEFGPTDFPLKTGQRLGYSGTSGTEHPHLHFEIRDTTGTVLNPQSFYPRIKDTRAPIIDELLLLPATAESRINGSRQSLLINPDTWTTPIQIQGPLRMAVNAHDRADGTYNKYNIYRAELFYNDSTAFRQTFEALPLRLSDNVDLIYPGMRGKRGWRFMALFEDDRAPSMPFAWDNLGGTLDVSGLAELRIKVADIKGNHKSTSVMVREHISSNWEIKKEHGHFVIIRHYPEQGYQRYQFFTGTKRYIPIAQTLHTVSTTQWHIPESNTTAGVQALAGLSDEIKWLIPPPQTDPDSLRLSWFRSEHNFYFRLSSETPYIFPISYTLHGPDDSISGELIQVDDRMAESELVPLRYRGRASSLSLTLPDQTLFSMPLVPLELLSAQEKYSQHFELAGLTVSAQNLSERPAFIQADTVTAQFGDQLVVGASLGLMGDLANIRASLDYENMGQDTGLGLFEPKNKNKWHLIQRQDSLGQIHRELQSGGEYFILKDIEAPTVKALSAPVNVRRGQRLVFKIADNTGELPHPRRALSATMNGEIFFPDYNPLRNELSFHIPATLARGSHRFDVSVKDAMGNIEEFSHPFTVTQ